MVFLAAVTLATWYGGWLPGLLTTALTAFFSAWYVFEPSNSIIIQNWEDLLRLAVFLFVAILMAMLHSSRERAIKQAWDTEQRLAFALQCANMGAWYSDLRTGKVWWSDSMEKLFGRPPGEFSGTYEGFVGYIHPDDQDFVKRAIMRNIGTDKDFEIEHRIVRPDGQVHWILTRGRILFDEKKVAMHVIAVAADITQKHEAETTASVTSVA